jgi:protoporphyrinogen oxidase
MDRISLPPNAREDAVMNRAPGKPAANKPWRRRDFLRLGATAALAAGYSRVATANPITGQSRADAGAHFDVVIVGGGIAGLTAAFYLRDLRILILEKEARAGGRILSSGPSSYIGRPYGALKEIVESLGLEPWEIPAPMEAAFRDDRYYAGSDGLGRFFTERGHGGEFERFKADVLAEAAGYQDIPELDFTTAQARLDDTTARRWFADRKLPAEMQSVYDIAARAMFGASLDDVSALAMIPELAFRLGGATGDAAAAGDGTGAFAFDGGLAGLTEVLARSLGGRFRPKSKVVRVDKKGADHVVEYADEAGRLRSVGAAFVVLAVPAPTALAIGSGILKPEARSLLGDIPYASCATATLTMNGPFPGHAFEVSLADGGIITGYRDPAWALRSRETGRGARQASLVVRAVPARLDESGWQGLADEEIAKAAVRAVSRLHPGLPAKLIGREVVRIARAHPVPVPGAFKRMARLNEISDGRVLLAGDHMIYPDFEAAADSGDFAAEKIRELI